MTTLESQRGRVGLGKPGLPQVIDPLSYPGWDRMLVAHPGHSFFHGTAWARVMQETYGHRPFYFCRFADDRLEELVPVMEVSSAWTGRRGVSLPFTDFCPWLKGSATGKGNGPGALQDLLVECGRARGWRYLECRGPAPEGSGDTPSQEFFSHCLDLQPGIETLFQGLDGAFRRGIRKAQRLAIRVEFGVGFGAVQSFFLMHCQTRRRHGLPPQPFRFFEAIARQVLEEGKGVVATVWAGWQAVAAAIFLHSAKEVIYKYGASDYQFQYLRPNNVMMWEAIKRFCAQGFTRLHLGRTSLSEAGLRRFKLALGAQEERLAYYKLDLRQRRLVVDKDRATGWFNSVFRCMPLPLLRLAGTILYPHLS